jgi:peptidoglycan/LPS O-acetylase OafA/YrhL
MTESRLAGADFIRAAACLFVLAHHLIQRLSPHAIDADLRPVFQFGLMGSFGVAAFFVLSGYLLSRPFWAAYDAGEPMPSLRTYALRRAARIVPGYWLALSVSFVLSFTLFGLTFMPDLFTRYLAGLLLVSDFHYTSLFPVEFNGPLWSISFEVTAYILLPFCLALVFLLPAPLLKGWVSRGAWLAVIAAALGAHYLIQRYWPIDNDMRGWNYGLVGGAKEWMPRFNPIGFFTVFALGVLAAALQVRWAKHRHWAFDALTVIGLALAAWQMQVFMLRGAGEGWGLFNVPYGFPVFPLAVGLALAAAPSSRIVGYVLDNPPVRYIAKISFGIYVWHFLVIEVVRHNWYERFYYAGTQVVSDWLMVSAAVTGITLLIAHVSYNVLEGPVIAWARRLEKRKPPAPAEPVAAGWTP